MSNKTYHALSMNEQIELQKLNDELIASMEIIAIAVKSTYCNLDWIANHANEMAAKAKAFKS